MTDELRSELSGDVQTLISPNPIFADMLQKLPVDNCVRKMYGLGHTDHLLAFWRPSSRSPLALEPDRILAPHEAMRKDFLKRRKRDSPAPLNLPPSGSSHRITEV